MIQEGSLYLCSARMATCTLVSLSVNEQVVLLRTTCVPKGPLSTRVSFYSQVGSCRDMRKGVLCRLVEDTMPDQMSMVSLSSFAFPQ